MNCEQAGAGTLAGSSPWAKQPEDDVSPVSVAYGPALVQSAQPSAKSATAVSNTSTAAPATTNVTTAVASPPPPRLAGWHPIGVSPQTSSTHRPAPASGRLQHQQGWSPAAPVGAPYGAPNVHANVFDPISARAPWANGAGAPPPASGVAAQVQQPSPTAATHSKPLEPHPYAPQYQQHQQACAPRYGAPVAPSSAGSSVPGVVAGVMDMISMHERTLMDEQTAAGAMSLLDVWEMRCESFESALTENTEEDEEKEEEEEDYGFFIEDSEWDDGSESRKPAWPTSRAPTTISRKPLAPPAAFQASGRHTQATCANTNANVNVDGVRAGTSCSSDSPRTLSISSPYGTKEYGQSPATPRSLQVQPHCQGGWPLPSVLPNPGVATSGVATGAGNSEALPPSAVDVAPFVPSGIAETEMGMYFLSMSLK